MDQWLDRPTEDERLEYQYLASKRLSDLVIRLYQYVRKYIEDFGNSPPIEQIPVALKWSRVRAVRNRLRILREAGLLTVDGLGNIHLTPAAIFKLSPLDKHLMRMIGDMVGDAPSAEMSVESIFHRMGQLGHAEQEISDSLSRCTAYGLLKKHKTRPVFTVPFSGQRIIAELNKSH